MKNMQSNNKHDNKTTAKKISSIYTIRIYAYNRLNTQVLYRITAQIVLVYIKASTRPTPFTAANTMRTDVPVHSGF